MKIGKMPYETQLNFISNSKKMIEIEGGNIRTLFRKLAWSETFLILEDYVTNAALLGLSEG